MKARDQRLKQLLEGSFTNLAEAYCSFVLEGFRTVNWTASELIMQKEIEEGYFKKITVKPSDFESRVVKVEDYFVDDSEEDKGESNA